MGRDLTEPKLDPSGRLLAFVARGASGAAISILDLTDDAWLERQLTTRPAPSPGRGTYGGCFDWAARWRSGHLCGERRRTVAATRPGRRRREVDHGRPRAPGRRTGGCAGRLVRGRTWWIWPRSGCSRWTTPLGRRLDDGEHDFCADPAVDPDEHDGHLPGMERARHAVGRRRGRNRRRRRVVADVVPAGRCGRPAAAVRPGRHAAARPRRHRLAAGVVGRPPARRGWRSDGARRRIVGSGAGCRSPAAPDGRHVAFTRNERGFGRLCVASVDDGAVTPIARGWHGQLSWQGKPAGGAALRCPHADAGGRLRHRHVGTAESSPSGRSPAGSRSTSSNRKPSSSHLDGTIAARPAVLLAPHRQRSAPARDDPRWADRAVAGDVHAAPRRTGSIAAGTSCCPTTADPPATDVPISRRSTDGGAISTSPTPWPGSTMPMPRDGPSRRAPS